MAEQARLAFYTVADTGYFLGAVGLVNSLRLVGHDEPVYVLDCGLAADERELLAGEATIVAGDAETPPWLLKSVAPLANPAATRVLLDSDLIATQPLTRLADAAASTGVAAFRNEIDRFVPEWGELIGLGPSRRRPYLCTAAVALAGAGGAAMLEGLRDAQRHVDFARTHWRGNDAGYPFLYADQDVFNAILSTLPDQRSAAALDHRLCPSIPFTGLRVEDAGELRCTSADGPEPIAVHHALSPKPWQAAGFDGVYSQLLRRLLTGPDLPLRVPERRVPRRFRQGPLARLERARVDAKERIRWRLGGADRGPRVSRRHRGARPA